PLAAATVRDHPDADHRIQSLHLPTHGPPQLSGRRARPAGLGGRLGRGWVQPAVATPLELPLDDLLGLDAEDLPPGIRPGVYGVHLLRSPRGGSVVRGAAGTGGAVDRPRRLVRLRPAGPAESRDSQPD